jgi:hypothetical protein
MDEGASQLFAEIGLEINDGHCMQTNSDAPLTVQLAEVLKGPNIIANKDSELQVVKHGAEKTVGFGVYEFNKDGTQRKFERIADSKAFPSHWAIAREGNYLLWGFTARWDQLTPEGRDLFVNVLFNHKRHT